jgi:trk system potassium uptake protein TrkH
MIRRVKGLRHGSETIAQTARFGIITLTIAKHAPVFPVLCMPPALWAAAERQWALCVALLVPAVASMIAFVGVRRHPLPDSFSKIEALVTVALVFLLGTLASTPAFVVLGMGPVDALFEAMSAITTTGLTVARDPDSWPFAAHFLRAWLQWCGGLVMATAVLALLLPPGVPTRRLGRAGIDQGDRIASTRGQARQLLGVYLGLTVIMALATVAVLPGWREGLVLTLTAISTAGFAPRADSLMSYSAAGQAIVMFSCVLGAMSLLTFALVLQGKPREAWQLGSARRVLFALGLLAALQTGLMLASGASGERIWIGLINLVSGLTTTGFSAGDVPTASAAGVLLIAAMVAGGDVGSTAGGIKLARMGLLRRLVTHVIRSARLPDNAVAPLRVEGRPVQPATTNALLALLALYISAVALIWAQALSHGYAPYPALFDVVSTVSTVGLTTGVVGPDLPLDLKLTLTFAMWLGRLEFVAVLVLLTPRTWTKRS